MFMLMGKRIKREISSSITKKYLLIFSTLFIIPLVLIYYLIVDHANSILEEDIITKNGLHADALAKRLNREIQDVVLQLQLITETKDDGSLDHSKMFNRAKQTISNSSMIHSVFYVDEQQNIHFEAPFLPDLGQGKYRYPGFEDVRWSLNFHVSDQIRNVHGKSVVSIAIPVLAKDQRFKGILVAELSQEYLSEVLKSISITNQGFSFLLDRNGRVIASTDEGELGKDYSNDPVAIQLAMDAAGSMKEKYKGEQGIIAYHSMRDGWGLALGVPENIAFQSLNYLSKLLSFGFIAILMFSLGLIGVGMRQLLYPMVGLTKLARDFTKEQSLRRIQNLKKYHSPDELGVLMRTIVTVGLSNLDKQRMLEEKERYLRDVIEGIPYAIVTMDKAGVITHMNLAFERLTGFHRDLIIGLPIKDVPIKKEHMDFVALQHLQSGKITEENETYIMDAEGHKHIVKVVSSKFFDENQNEIGIIAMLEDISQLKLLEAHAKQREKLAVIGQITTGIAHEIKNPLAILSGASELLKEEVEDYQCGGMIEELTEDIHQVVKRMKVITNDFLKFAKINTDAVKPIRMDKLLDEVLHLLRIKLKECKVNVDRMVEENAACVEGKYDQLMQVYLNLILNSVDAMPEGGDLTVRVYQEQERVFVEIEDSGMGIPTQNLDWLYNPFFSTKEEGSGLGLTIARDIIVEHGGNIRIESEEKKGTRIITSFNISRKG
ncbi:PAS domain-containing sensor histidine kinase [Ammoniphilus sp. YIM 78166]|uniref:sensor histidine kinase n=1 Tax=Ammoniphilus sp. YIM 78166 TaxID=1644106 RepID=UPI00106FEC59|nr:PAS domain-containing sensor histidine kinase [Ammoniphilus sp. YIM 78166]